MGKAQNSWIVFNFCEGRAYRPDFFRTPTAMLFGEADSKIKREEKTMHEHYVYKLVYAATFSDRIEFLTDSMSRAFIDKHPDIFDSIQAFTGIGDIITFKKYGKGELYYGKTDGRDICNGKDCILR